MKRNSKVYVIILGLIIAFFLLYTSSFSSIPAPKFSYSIKSATHTVTNEFTTQVGAGIIQTLSK